MYFTTDSGDRHVEFEAIRVFGGPLEEFYV